MAGSQELVDLRRGLAHHALQVVVERVNHIGDSLTADRFFVLYQAVPDVAVGLPIHQFYLQRDLCLNGRAIDFAELVELAQQNVVAGGQAA